MSSRTRTRVVLDSRSPTLKSPGPSLSRPDPVASPPLPRPWYAIFWVAGGAHTPPSRTTPDPDPELVPPSLSTGFLPGPHSDSDHRRDWVVGPRTRRPTGLTPDRSWSTSRSRYEVRVCEPPPVSAGLHAFGAGLQEFRDERRPPRPRRPASFPTSLQTDSSSFAV